MSKDEAIKLALEHLKDNQHLVAEHERHAYVMEYNAVIERVEEALATQPTGKAPCERHCEANAFKIEIRGLRKRSEEVQRFWVGLTDEEIEECWDGYLSDYQLQMIREMETKLKEKNT